MRTFRIVCVVLISIAVVVSIVVAATRYRPAPTALCPSCNVILISVDTLGAKHTSLYTPSLSTTPYLSALARERGVVFEHAYSQAPWTLPSHAAMFTGRYPWDIGILEAGDALPLRETTIAEVLHENGYATKAVSNGAFVHPLWQMTQGFETFSGSYFEKDWNDLPQLFRTGSSLIDQASKATPKKPFFVLLRPFMVHDPYGERGTEGTITISDIVAANSLPQRPDSPEAQAFTAAYHKEVTLTDAALKEFVEGLAAQGLLESTILIITADHGEEFGEHGTVGAHSASVHRENLWVPLIVIIPGVAPARIPASVEIRSIPATIAELVGVPASTFEGASLVPLITGDETNDRIVQSQTALTRSGFLSSIESIYNHPDFFKEVLAPREREGGVPNFTQSIIQGNWHLIRENTKSVPALYDMDADPQETIDLMPKVPSMMPSAKQQIQTLLGLLVAS